MTERKRNIIRQLLQEYDIETAEDIYVTPNGIGIWNYILVVAKGHVKAKAVEGNCNVAIYNLGTSLG